MKKLELEINDCKHIARYDKFEPKQQPKKKVMKTWYCYVKTGLAKIGYLEKLKTI